MSDFEIFSDEALLHKLFRAVIIAKDSVDLVTRALDEGADPNYSQNDRNFRTSVLHSAVKDARDLRREKIDLLINRKCDVNILDRYERQTALMLACDNRRNLAIVEQLLNLEADPNIISRSGRTALTEAVWAGSNEMVQLLLDRGADGNPPVLRDTPGYIYTGEPEYVGTVEEGPIIGAVHRTGDPAVGIMLLERGANPNVRSTYKSTPLCIATQRDDMAMVEMLLERNADPNMLSSEDWMLSTPLLICAKEHDDVRMAAMLIEHGADPNLPAGQHTPLC
jgi:ankyrin repeat protein